MCAVKLLVHVPRLVFVSLIFGAGSTLTLVKCFLVLLWTCGVRYRIVGAGREVCVSMCAV